MPIRVPPGTLPAALMGNQSAVLDLRTRFHVIVFGLHVDARHTIRDLAVLAAPSLLRQDFIQEWLQLDLIGLRQIVENVLRKLDTRQVDDGLFDGKVCAAALIVTL